VDIVAIGAYQTRHIVRRWDFSFCFMTALEAIAHINYLVIKVIMYDVFYRL